MPKKNHSRTSQQKKERQERKMADKNPLSEKNLEHYRTEVRCRCKICHYIDDYLAPTH